MLCFGFGFDIDILLVPHDGRHFLFVRRVHPSRPRLEPKIPIKSDQHDLGSVPIPSGARSEDSRPIDEMVQLERSNIQYPIVHCPFILLSLVRFRPDEKVG